MRKLFAVAGIGMLSLLLGVSVTAWAQDDKPRQDEPKQAEAQDEATPKPKEDKAPKQDESKQERQQEKNQRPAAVQSGKGGRIPDAKFRANFGRQHTVVIHQPVIVQGQPRFQFGGYWFIISEPWPAGWAYTDECYIDFVDGEYVLLDLLHPGMQVVLVVAT